MCGTVVFSKVKVSRKSKGIILYVSYTGKLGCLLSLVTPGIAKLSCLYGVGDHRLLYRLMNGSPPCRRISKNIDSLNYKVNY